MINIYPGIFTFYCKKLSRENDILSKLWYYVPIQTCLQVYYAIFYSHLIYGCNVWGLTSHENLYKIEVLQRKCFRIISFSCFESHPNHLFTEYKILKVRHVITLQQIQLLHSFLDNSSPANLKKLFKLNEDVHIPGVNFCWTLSSVNFFVNLFYGFHWRNKFNSILFLLLVFFLFFDDNFLR